VEEVEAPRDGHAGSMAGTALPVFTRSTVHFVSFAPPVADIAHVRQSSAVALSPYWPALVLSALPAACLLWGLVTGRMPQRYGTFDRQTEAAGYWTMTATWAVFLGILLWVGFRL